MTTSGQSPQDVFRHRLAKVRKALGYSSQTSFARRVTELGGGLSETAIARIESGERNVRLDEALMIAAVLDVSPLTLFLPTEGSLRLAEGVEVDHDHARRWLMGEEPLDPEHEAAYRYVSPKPTLDLSASTDAEPEDLTPQQIVDLLRPLGEWAERQLAEEG